MATQKEVEAHARRLAAEGKNGLTIRAELIAIYGPELVVKALIAIARAPFKKKKKNSSWTH